MIPRRVEVIKSVVAWARCVSVTTTIVQADRKSRGVTYRYTDVQALRTESADAADCKMQTREQNRAARPRRRAVMASGLIIRPARPRMLPILPSVVRVGHPGRHGPMAMTGVAW